MSPLCCILLLLLPAASAFAFSAGNTPVHTYRYLCIFLHICFHFCIVCTYVYMHGVCMYVCVYVCMCVCMCVCVCVCVCVYAYMMRLRHLTSNRQQTKKSIACAGGQEFKFCSGPCRCRSHAHTVVTRFTRYCSCVFDSNGRSRGSLAQRENITHVRSLLLP